MTWPTFGKTVTAAIVCCLIGGALRFVEAVAPQHANAQLRTYMRAPVSVQGIDNVAVSGTLTLADGTVTAPALAFTGASSNTGIYLSATDTLAISADGAQKMRCASGGCVFASGINLDNSGAAPLVYNSGSGFIDLQANSRVRGSFGYDPAGGTSYLRPPVLHGTGTAQQAIERNSAALVANELAVTFATAFGAAPVCVCTHVNTTNSNPCTIKSGSAPTTTAVTFTVASGGTDVIHWMCLGQN